MRERDVLRGNPREERRHRPDARAPVTERALRGDGPPADRRAADDDWQAFAAEDPAFFIKGL